MHDTPVPEVFASLGGATVAYNEAHVVARIALMNHLLSYAPCVEMLDECASRHGLLEPALQCRDALLGVRDAARLPSMEALYSALEEAEATGTITINEVDEVEESQIQAEFDAALARFVTAHDDFEAAVDKLAGDKVGREIVKFVKDDLELPWAWVAWELTEVFYYRLNGLATHQHHHKNIWSEPFDPPADVGCFEFAPLPGESMLQAAKRFHADASVYFTELSSPLVAVTPGQRRDPETIERYVDWYFRNHILGESKRGIANTPSDPYDRKTVIDGINTAIGLLGIAGQFWKEAPDDDKAVILAERFWATDE